MYQAMYQLDNHLLYMSYILIDNSYYLTHLLIDEKIESKLEMKNSFTDSIYQLVKRYFEGEEIDFTSIPIFIDRDKESLAYKVYKYMHTIKYGEVKSYKQIGEAIDSKAYRAIGKICSQNQLFLIIPCHRIIYQNGKIGEYRWGKELKRKLLLLEGGKK